MSRKAVQSTLLDIEPANKAALLRVLDALAKASDERAWAKQCEDDAKEKLLALVNDADLQRLPDGSIVFTIDGTRVTIKPGKETVKLKPVGDANEPDEEGEE